LESFVVSLVWKRLLVGHALTAMLAFGAYANPEENGKEFSWQGSPACWQTKEKIRHEADRYALARIFSAEPSF